MGKKIDAVETAARISRAYGIPICELVDLFAEIPDADKPKDCGSCKWCADNLRNAISEITHYMESDAFCEAPSNAAMSVTLGVLREKLCEMEDKS